MPAQPSAPPTSPREALLDKAIDHLANHGLGDTSLRQLAGALGTSHRMLIYHFGSKEGLLVGVVRAVEKRQRATLAGIAAEIGDGSAAEIMRRFWRRLADPQLWPHERLFFELYGQALQGRPHALALLDGVVDAWIEPAVELARRHGVPTDDARAQARLGLAVIRGLLLDLLATGDRRGVDEAMEHHIASLAGHEAAHRGALRRLGKGG
ncbi:MAG: TetR/AcrR family transcriptional regulator [Acidimicrobiales bacterium]